MFKFGDAISRSDSYIKSIEKEHQANRLHFSLSPQIDMHGNIGLKTAINF
jgi:hypothetical protein